MDDSSDGQRLASWVVDDQIRTDGPKQNRLVSEILADVTDARILGKALASIKEIQPNFACSFCAVCPAM